MKIREATLEDIPAIIEMGVEMTDESPVLSSKVPDYKKQYYVLTSLIESSTGVVLVADDLTGMIIGHLQEDPWYEGRQGYEDVLFVRKSCRNSSRAVRLVKEFLEWCKGMGADSVYVGNHIGSNEETTQSLYEGLGAVMEPGITMKFTLEVEEV